MKEMQSVALFYIFTLFYYVKSGTTSEDNFPGYREKNFEIIILIAL